jgi:hypothetical protein
MSLDGANEAGDYLLSQPFVLLPKIRGARRAGVYQARARRRG